MALQKLWYVSLDEGPDAVAIGPIAEQALSTMLTFRYRMKLRRRQHVMEKKYYRMTAAGFYELTDGKAVACHEDDPPFGSKPIDPLWWLLDQEPEELLFLIKQLNWGRMGSRSDRMHQLYQRVGRMMQRPGKKIKTSAPWARSAWMFEMAMMLRISLVVDVAMQAPFKTHSGQRAQRDLDKLVASKTDERRMQFIDMHKANLGVEMAASLAEFPGFDWGRLRTQEADEIKRLCAAYGYNADEIPFNEVMALYRGGPLELARLKSRRALGMTDTIINYELKEWPKRAKLQKYLKTLSKGQSRTKFKL